MKKKFFIILPVLFISSCGIYNKEMSSLSTDQRARLDSMMEQRKRCFINNIYQQDNGKESAKNLAEIVYWKCSHFDTQINAMLYKDFNVRLGAVYHYMTRIKDEAPNEIVEAILAKRKAEEPRNNNGEMLKKNPN